MPEIIPPAAAAASSDIVKILIASYRNERGVHAETIIGAAAALAGEFALRAAEPKLPENGWVLGSGLAGRGRGGGGRGLAEHRHCRGQEQDAPSLNQHAGYKRQGARTSQGWSPTPLRKRPRGPGDGP